VLLHVKYFVFVGSLRGTCFGEAFYVVLSLNTTAPATKRPHSPFQPCFHLTPASFPFCYLHPAHMCFMILLLEGDISYFVCTGGVVQ